MQIDVFGGGIGRPCGSSAEDGREIVRRMTQRYTILLHDLSAAVALAHEGLCALTCVHVIGDPRWGHACSSVAALVDWNADDTLAVMWHAGPR